MAGKKEGEITWVLFAIALALIAIMPAVSAFIFDDSNVNFEIRFSETSCNDNGDMWVYPDGTSSNSLNDCKLSVGSAEKICCPLGYNCEQSGGDWNCIANSTFTCFDYKTQGACSGYAESTAKNSIYRTTGKACGSFEYVSGADCVDQIINCKCAWNSGAGKCDSQYNVNRNCSDGTGGILGACAFNDGGSTGCEEDIMLLKWTSSWSGAEADKPAECADGSRQVPCKPTIKLPFFTATNIIAAVIILAIIYIIYSLANKKRVGGSAQQVIQQIVKVQQGVQHERGIIKKKTKKSRRLARGKK